MAYTIVTGLSILVIQPTFARPEDFGPNVSPHPHAERFRDTRPQRPMDRDYRHSNNFRDHPNPQQGSNAWRVGKTLPDQYKFNAAQVDYTQNNRLSQPTRYQQWIKVNDRYMLINVMTNTILKIVHE
ncbi:RcnB family protein [Acinetobacter qingfengensis]|uniref:RcnB family protein n=1 Tax=Acinetobacter qingfengensis TaxID=1262585 RepID=A0A1E7R549_9GAMM|nr:RcnB family protein [Acinetobacter qingfengensis]OEY94431.1 hypothetical protein BJI46_03565 [Acinetobacter qingfengensis]